MLVSRRAVRGLFPGSWVGRGVVARLHECWGLGFGGEAVFLEVGWCARLWPVFMNVGVSALDEGPLFLKLGPVCAAWPDFKKVGLSAAAPSLCRHSRRSPAAPI